MYIRDILIKSSTMKLLFASLLLCVSLGYATSTTTEPVSSLKKEKTDREKKKKGDNERAFRNKNLHSLKKWKITIEYTNGTIISKTIVVSEGSKLSALETAFAEADKYLDNKKNVKEYSISPVTNNYVLLAGD